MALSDPVGDLLTRIRNGQSCRDATVNSPASRLRVALLDVLQKEGYIRGYSEAELQPGKRELTIELKYHEGEPVIREIKRVSTPGRRVYSQIKTLRPVHGGLGIAILSTPMGVLSDADARAANVGGEVLCQVF
jgi:small subunit ribosomal protein S8